VESKVVNSRKLEGVEDGIFNHVVTNFGLTPGTEDKESTKKIAKEIWRVLGDGGVAVVTTWAGSLPLSFHSRKMTGVKEFTDSKQSVISQMLSKQQLCLSAPQRSPSPGTFQISGLEALG
jgi:ubiquinone/menaquinone biosynthesis C-methylase UbiE